jgi:succinoglycan biosynthesis transport protein ExoP
MPPTSIQIMPTYQGMPEFSDPPVGKAPLPKQWKRQRLVLFLAVFCLCLASSLTYVWLREPIFQSTASLLTVAPEEAGLERGSNSVNQAINQEDGWLPSVHLAAIEGSNTAVNSEHVTLQRQFLQGVPVLEETLRRLYQPHDTSGIPRLSLNDLHELLSVSIVSGTNMVEMKAQGPQPSVLAPLVNAWIDAYQALREQTTLSATVNNVAVLEEESRQLGKKVEAKRKALEEFREAHDILSRTDADNSPMMKMKALNEAVNRATDEQVKAKSKLEAIRVAIARGEPVMPPEDAPGLTNLEKRAQELRELLKDSQRRFTPAYMAINPQMKLIPEKLAQVEAAILEKLQYGGRAMLSKSAQDLAAAEQTVQELRQKIIDMKRESLEFTNHFAEQQTMEDDLKRLEAMHRDTQAKLAHMESKPEVPYPHLQVLERAYPPTQAFWPDYWRDSGVSVLVSLVVSVLFIWLYDYLTRIGQAPAPAMPNFQFYSVQGGLASNPYEAEAPALLARPSPAPLNLESPFPRELTLHEINLLLDASDVKTQCWIGLLLSGLSVEEAAALREENVDIAANLIHIKGASPRTVPLPPRLKEGFSQHALHLAHSEPDEVSAHIACAAIDSGLPRPETIDAAAVRHTYIAYLVRQGIRLSELERIVGLFRVTTLAAYGRLSPHGPGLPANRIAQVHPALFSVDRV